MVSPWSLSDIEYLLFSRTLLSILANFDDAVLQKVSTYFQVLQSLYQSFNDSAKITNHNWYHCHFHVLLFFQFPNQVQVLILFFAFFQFYPMISQDSKILNSASSFFLILITRSGSLAMMFHLYLKIPNFVHLIL